MGVRVHWKARKSPSLTEVRPSVLDHRLRGDPWISSCTHPDLLVMYLNNHPVTLVPGSSLELASLNQILFGLRRRYPRQVQQ